MSTTEVMDLFPDKCGERSESETESKKLCADCKTTKTPLWRSGPHGPKSLCNACGIKFRKKKGGDTVMVLKKESSDKKKDKSSPSSSSSTTACAGHKKGNNGKTSSVSSRGNDGNLGRKLKVRLMGFGQEMVLLRRPRSPMKRQWSGRKKLGEVEEAAVLLMAMSCASIYA